MKGQLGASVDGVPVSPACVRGRKYAGESGGILASVSTGCGTTLQAEELTSALKTWRRSNIWEGS